MKHSTTRSFYPRALTERERVVTRWLIEHGRISEEEKKKHLTELECATVVRMCDCGCASIDFAIAGVKSEPTAPLHPFGDFISSDKKSGVFIFSKEGHLAGVEVYPLSDLDAPQELPAPDSLALWEEANQPLQPTPGTGSVSNFESPTRRG